MTRRVSKNKSDSGEEISLSSKALQSMKRAMIRFRTLMDERLRPYNVTTSQVQVLFAIRKSPASSGAQLARLCYVTPQSMQTLLKQLERADLISRMKDPVNDRIVTASVTAGGERLAAKVEALSKEIQGQLWKNVPEDDMIRLNTILERCIENLGGAE
jgi:DNA-binding MarR family transcriptional regulator